MPDFSPPHPEQSASRENRYKDFDVEIRKGTGQDYEVIVSHSPSGEAREVLHFPYDSQKLERQLDKLQIALGRGRTRQICSEDEQPVKDFGRELFNSLFTGEIRTRFDMSRHDVEQQGMGLRLRLHIDPPELAVLPWEFLFDQRLGDYICLSRNTPVVRYLDLPRNIKPISVRPPLRILGLVASPNDRAPLDVYREKSLVEKAIQPLKERGLLELVWLEGQTWRDLQRKMNEGPWHIFHFIGHGGFDKIADEGMIALTADDGSTYPIHAQQLARLLADHTSLRLVVLNACEGARGSQHDIFSSTASILIRRGIPAVIAMQYEISDQAAIEFSSAFYESLAYGYPVDTSMADARKAVSFAFTRTVEWGTPVLYLRSPDGVLFHVEKPKEPPPPSASPSPSSRLSPQPIDRKPEQPSYYIPPVSAKEQKEEVPPPAPPQPIVQQPGPQSYYIPPASVKKQKEEVPPPNPPRPIVQQSEPQSYFIPPASAKKHEEEVPPPAPPRQPTPQQPGPPPEVTPVPPATGLRTLVIIMIVVIAFVFVSVCVAGLIYGMNQKGLLQPTPPPPSTLPAETVLFQDKFNQVSNIPESSTPGVGNAIYRNGMYVLQSSGPRDSSYIHFLLEAGELPSDIRIEVDATLINGSLTDTSGMIFGMKQDNNSKSSYYGLESNGIGYYELRNWQGGVAKKALKYGVNSNIVHTGYNTPNALKVEIYEHKIVYYINGVQLGQFDASDDITGYIGLMTGAAGTEAGFNNLKVTQLAPGSAPPPPPETPVPEVTASIIPTTVETTPVPTTSEYHDILSATSLHSGEILWVNGTSRNSQSITVTIFSYPAGSFYMTKTFGVFSGSYQGAIQTTNLPHGQYTIWIQELPSGVSYKESFNII